MFVFVRRVRHVARAEIINESYTGGDAFTEKVSFFSWPFEKLQRLNFFFREQPLDSESSVYSQTATVGSSKTPLKHKVSRLLSSVITLCGSSSISSLMCSDISPAVNRQSEKRTLNKSSFIFNFAILTKQVLKILTWIFISCSARKQFKSTKC